MRLFLLIGGFGGFLLALGASFHAGNEAIYALRDGAVGCVIGAMILRGMYFVVMSNLRSRIIEQSLANKAKRTALADNSNRPS